MYTYTYTYMNITTYIRKEDEHLWKAIPNKAEWLHAQLNNLEYLGSPEAVNEPTYAEVPPAPRKSTITLPEVPTEAPPKLKVMNNDDLKTLLGQAIEDKPRHICKENCYHWIYDINSAQYVNSLTGETREAPDF